jgi:tetratricopeptide (TPR) repeat protein
VLAVYFILRTSVVESVFMSKTGHEFWRSAFYAPFLVLYNLKLILFPYGLHSYIIEYPESVLNWQFLVGLIGLGSFLLLIYLCKGKKALVFSLLAFLIALGPILNIIPTSAPTLISMRWLYFPMLFLFIAGAWLMERLLRANRALFLCLLPLVVVYFGSYAFVLNEELWHDETTFLEQEVIRFGNYYYADGLAKILHKKNEYERSRFLFEAAIKHAPTRPDNYINYAALLIDLRKHDRALANLEKAQSLPLTRSSKGALYVNKGVLYFRLNKPQKAVSNFSRAVKYCPEKPKYWTDLGAGYMLAKDYENAIEALKRGLAMDSSSFRTRKLLGLSYFRAGEYDNAIEVVESIPDKRRREDRSIADLLNDAYAKRRDELSKVSKHAP